MIFLPDPNYPILFHIGSLGLVVCLGYIYGKAGGLFK